MRIEQHGVGQTNSAVHLKPVVLKLKGVHVSLGPAAQVEALRADLNSILGWIEMLDEVDVTGVEPLTGGTQMALRLREDAVTDGGMAEAVLGNAPDRNGAYFGVPKVVE